MGPLSLSRRSTLCLPVAAFAQRRRPNILFFFPDQHRHDWVGGNAGLPVLTPHLDSIGKQGVRFTRAMVASPLCAPSRACLASGREYGRCPVRNNSYDYPLELPTFYQSLRESGYAVLGCGKIDLHKATRDWGIDGRRFLPEWGFTAGIDNAGKGDAVSSGAVEPRDPYMAYLHSRGLATMHLDDFRRRRQGQSYTNTEPTPLPEEAYCDNWVAQNGLSLLRAVPAGKPWFLQVNFTGPHNPLDITRRMERSVRRRSYPQPVDSEQYTAERHVAMRQNYTAMVENIDRWLGVYLDEIKRRGEADNTYVVWCSDHGEMLGDHELWGKSVPYQPAVGVPLVMAGPGVRRGAPAEALVNHIDLAATFLDWAGAAPLRDSDSQSLRAVAEGKAQSHREFVRSGLDKWRMVFDGRYKLIRGYGMPKSGGGKGKPAEPGMILFDRKLDPEETSNIVHKVPEEVERLSKLL